MLGVQLFAEAEAFGCRRQKGRRAVFGRFAEAEAGSASGEFAQFPCRVVKGGDGNRAQKTSGRGVGNVEKKDWAENGAKGNKCIKENTAAQTATALIAESLDNDSHIFDAKNFLLLGMFSNQRRITC